jgi:hypothetical protein
VSFTFQPLYSQVCQHEHSGGAEQDTCSSYNIEGRIKLIKYKSSVSTHRQINIEILWRDFSK